MKLLHNQHKNSKSDKKYFGQCARKKELFARFLTLSSLL